MNSKDRLVAALRGANAPEAMIERAARGAYSDYESEYTFPELALLRDAMKHNLPDIARRAEAGEFDATKEESEAWAKRMAADPHMGPLLKKLGLEAKD